MQDLYDSHTVFVSARPAREDEVPEYLIKGELTTLVGLYVTGIVSKA